MRLEKMFVSNPYFLYNYAAVLQEMKQYTESLEVALKCRQYWADYDLELIIGENYQQLLTNLNWRKNIIIVHL